MSAVEDGYDDYPCVGICMIDPDSGYCLGCGRPPVAVMRSDPQNMDDTQCDAFIAPERQETDLPITR